MNFLKLLKIIGLLFGGIRNNIYICNRIQSYAIASTYTKVNLSYCLIFDVEVLSRLQA
jgi:hypothetical protein